MIDKNKITPEVLYEVKNLMSASTNDFKDGWKRIAAMLGVELRDNLSDFEVEKLQQQMNDRILDMLLQYKIND